MTLQSSIIVLQTLKLGDSVGCGGASRPSSACASG
jgi:hypothetical protein